MNEIIPTSDLKSPLEGVPDPWSEETPSVDASKTRVFSAQRMKYSAEVQLIKNQHGDLESIRKTLGLSQRKMAQLLFVDPSAWTRWTRESGSAPPHIYRALSWFLLLQERTPGMSPYNWLQTVARPQLSAHEIASVKSKLEANLLHDFEERLTMKEKLLRKLLLANGAAAFIALALVILAFWIK